MTQQVYTAEFGKWIRAQRDELELKQQDVAAALGVSDATLSNWERGIATISGYNERRLRSYFKGLRGEQGGA